MCRTSTISQGFVAVVVTSFAGLCCPAVEAVAQSAMKQPRKSELTVLTARAEKARAAKPGSTFKECAKGCPEMVVIPAGQFTMGSPANDPDRADSEGPQHKVAIAKPFAVSRFEVTFDDWDACTVAFACAQVPDHWGRGKMPVINVSWEDAKAYVVWLSQVTGKDYRLPTEAEWEYAARAGTTTRYYWGDDAAAGDANCDGCGGDWKLQQTSPVGTFKPNAFGLHDMVGNVWEWVEDPWHETYVGAPTDASVWLQDSDPNFRMVRGGSWRNESERVRSASRVRRNRLVEFDTLGFRVARTMAP
ncbi:formylglycine-generating enzyme family protein [Bradyrhizobium sp. SYSU BS000235]|uniref:formylglycine-generating enzyme family protein n=1 Tax=Bradyrhizobium sp. SYSU BS000235 TaxID=3411332 RepID=UPI003C7479A9